MINQNKLDGLLTSPLFNFGVGLLSGNVRGPGFRNPIQMGMQNVLIGQQLKRQAENDLVNREKHDIEMRYKKGQINQQESIQNWNEHRPSGLYGHEQRVDMLNHMTAHPNPVIAMGAMDKLHSLNQPQTPNLPQGFTWNPILGKAERIPGLPVPQSKRETAKDAEGYLRYLDNGSRVFPNAQKPIDPKHGENNFKYADSLRDEYVAQSKDFVKVRDSFGRILSSSENPSPAGDLSLIFNYMKMLDPQSVVRESEFRTAETAAPLLQKMGLSFDKVASVWQGQKLTDAQRKDFVNRAQQLYNSQSDSQQSLSDTYTGLANRFEINPSNVVIDYGAPIQNRLNPTSMTSPQVTVGNIPKEADPRMLQQLEDEGLINLRNKYGLE